MKDVIARMIVTFVGSKKKVIVEVHKDASFQKFYTWYSQTGRDHKNQIMTSHRGYGIEPHWRQAFETPGLELVADRYTRTRRDVDNVVIKVFRKREYNRMLNCAPDELTGGLPKAADIQGKINTYNAQRRGIPVRLPVGYLTLQKRMDLVNGSS